MRGLCVTVSIILATCLSLPAQRTTGPRGGRSASVPRIVSPELNPTQGIFLSGKVVVADGSPLTEPATIFTICRGVKKTETHTDSHGNFSFQFGDHLAMSSDVDFDADSSTRSTGTLRPERRNLQECEVQASLAGFTSDIIALGGKFAGDQSADIGRVVLHRLANVEGFTISATTAEAPSAARKALEKGRELARRGKWEEAQKSLEKAVAVFPRFAVAWFELGQVQLSRNDAAAARNSFLQSIAADAKYVNPYQGLVRMATRARNWPELTDFSEKLLALNPLSFPDVWLSNSLGHYCQQNWVAAEKSARRGLEIDSEHRVPKLEYMLGLILLEKSDYAEATRHMQTFLGRATKPEDITEAQNQLAEIDRRTAAANLAPAK